MKAVEIYQLVFMKNFLSP